MEDNTDKIKWLLDEWQEHKSKYDQIQNRREYQKTANIRMEEIEYNTHTLLKKKILDELISLGVPNPKSLL